MPSKYITQNGVEWREGWPKHTDFLNWRGYFSVGGSDWGFTICAEGSECWGRGAALQSECAAGECTIEGQGSCQDYQVGLLWWFNQNWIHASRIYLAKSSVQHPAGDFLIIIIRI